MKHLILSTALFAFGLLTHGQTGDFDIKGTQKTLAKINASLYASKYETTNKQYVVFLNSLKQRNLAEKYATAQIDSARWKDKLTYNEPYVQYYHSHPAYANYPVVNISYEGATLFCEWMTAQYNSNKKRKFQKVRFRLPTEEEWTTAAKGKEDNTMFPWCGNKLVNKKGQYLCNYKQVAAQMGVAGKVSDNADITAPVESYWSNDFGLYNMSGNVAEMVADKGVLKGGSWSDPAEYMKYDHVDKYSDNVKPTIGFRYFMDVMEK